MGKAILVGFLDLYRRRKPEDSGKDVETAEEEELEPLPKLELAEFWPPSPRVKMLYIGLAFVIVNLVIVLVLAFLVYNRFA